MPLTLTSDIPQPAVHQIKLIAVVDVDANTITLHAQQVDASGNVLSTSPSAVPPARALALCNAFRNPLYNEYIVGHGVTGTVT